MQAQKLTDIRKELQSLDRQHLVEVCLRLARYKKDNKELLTFLLFEADSALNYAEKVKAAYQEDFKLLLRNSFQNIKITKRILRAVNKHAKYTLSKEAEIELLIWFCRNLIQNINFNSAYKLLQNILIKQLTKINTSIGKLHEDLQFDYRREFEKLIEEIEANWRHFNKKDVGL